MILFIEGVAGAWISECWVVRKREREGVRVGVCVCEREIQRERNRERDRVSEWLSSSDVTRLSRKQKLKTFLTRFCSSGHLSPTLSPSLTLSHTLTHSHTHSRSHSLPRKNYFIHWACWLLERRKKWTGVNWPWRKTSKPNCVRVLLHLNGFY